MTDFAASESGKEERGSRRTANNMPTAYSSNKHTIVLMQTSPSRATLTFMDDYSITAAVDDWNATLEYNSHLIFAVYVSAGYMKGSCSYEHSVQGYLPYDLQWIKQLTFHHFKKLALSSEEFAACYTVISHLGPCDLKPRRISG